MYQVFPTPHVFRGQSCDFFAKSGNLKSYLKEFINSNLKWINLAILRGKCSKNRLLNIPPRLARPVDRRGVLALALLRHPDRHHDPLAAEPEQPEIRLHSITRQRRYFRVKHICMLHASFLHWHIPQGSRASALQASKQASLFYKATT
jgi:hypothetical protein